METLSEEEMQVIVEKAQILLNCPGTEPRGIEYEVDRYPFLHFLVDYMNQQQGGWTATLVRRRKLNEIHAFPPLS